MPTFRDAPWERDERAIKQREARTKEKLRQPPATQVAAAGMKPPPPPPPTRIGTRFIDEEGDTGKSQRVASRRHFSEANRYAVYLTLIILLGAIWLAQQGENGAHFSAWFLGAVIVGALLVWAILRAKRDTK